MTDKLKQGRESYQRRAWGDAYQSLSLADQATPLGVKDLELLATSAYMLGRDDDYLNGLERAHHAYLNVGEALRILGGDATVHPRRDGTGDRMARSGPAAGRTRAAQLP